MGVEARARVKGGFRGTPGTPPRSATGRDRRSARVPRGIGVIEREALFVPPSKPIPVCSIGIGLQYIVLHYDHNNSRCGMRPKISESRTFSRATC